MSYESFSSCRRHLHPLLGTKSPSEFRANFADTAHSVVRRNPIPVVRESGQGAGQNSWRDPTIDRGCRANERVSRRKRFVGQTGRSPDVFTSARCPCSGKKPEISNRQSVPPFNVSLLLTSCLSLSQGASLRVPGRPNLGNYHRVRTQQRRTFTSVLEREVAKMVCAQQRKKKRRKRREEKKKEKKKKKRPLFV